MTTATAKHNAQFDWQPQPEAFAFVKDLVAKFLDACPQAKNLAERMHRDSGNRFIDWVDHIHLQESEGLRIRAIEVGYVQKPRAGAPGRLVHEGGFFPDLLLEDRRDATVRLAIKVDDVSHFLAVHSIGPERRIIGEPLSFMRRACAFIAPGAEMWVMERHGYKGYDSKEAPSIDPKLVLHHLDQFCRRRRDWATDKEGFDHAAALIDGAIADFGGGPMARDRACDLFFEGERRYWMRRNRAAQVQYARQNALGLGWANHDHHTYRSSRENFTSLIACLERLGVFCRERFHAGAEAGWGAQVMESPTSGIICVCDVDLSPDEVMADFSHETLPSREQLGTIGLWAGLHGEAFLQAGMHHLECMFDWHALKDQLQKEAGITTMDPFTTFSYLRQAFTEGERWAVSSARVDRLVAAGRITAEQGVQFKEHGALGSHLENLERNDGYKGFNKEGISDIITRTDARRHPIGGAKH